MKHFAYVIVGAGFAGAATAYHLARRGIGDVLVLEQEGVPGFHASGRNAAMLRQCVAEPDLTKLALDGATFICNLPKDWPELTITRIHLHGHVLDVTAKRDGTVSVSGTGPADETLIVEAPQRVKVSSGGNVSVRLKTVD